MHAEVLTASRATLARKAKSFHFASHLLPRPTREDAALVYAFCRTIDDAADEALSAEVAAHQLDELLEELRGEREPRPLVREFLRMAHRVDLPLGSVEALIEGVRWDLQPVRVDDDDELIRYCYRVASTVGLMMCAVLGVREHRALPFAVDLGIAMQLTNIVRDVAEDAARNRVYLPASRLRAAGVDPESLPRQAAQPVGVSLVVKELISLAERYYRSADGGMRDIPWRARQAILVASRVYRGIGDSLRKRAGNPLSGRAFVPLPEKFVLGSKALVAGIHPDILGIATPRIHDATLHLAIRGFPGTHGA
jgi:15-cis-phytoene synthase